MFLSSLLVAGKTVAVRIGDGDSPIVGCISLPSPVLPSMSATITPLAQTTTSVPTTSELPQTTATQSISTTSELPQTTATPRVSVTSKSQGKTSGGH